MAMPNLEKTGFSFLGTRDQLVAVDQIMIDKNTVDLPWRIGKFHAGNVAIGIIIATTYPGYLEKINKLIKNVQRCYKSISSSTLWAGPCHTFSF